MNEDRGAGGGDLFDGGEDFLHGWGGAEEAFEAEFFVDLVVEFDHFAFHLAGAEGAADEDFEAIDIEGFGDEIVGAAFHGFHGDIDRAVGGHHDDDRGVWEGEDLVDEFHAAFAAEAEIGEDEVDGFAFEDAESA